MTTNAQTEVRALLGQHALDDETWQTLRTFEHVASEVAEAVWDLEKSIYGNLDHAVGLVESRLGSRETTHGAATYMLHPHLRLTVYYEREYGQHDQREYTRQRAVLAIAKRCLDLRLPEDWIMRLGRRMYDLGSTPSLGYENGYSSWHPAEEHAGFGTCVTWALQAAATNAIPDIDAFLDALTCSEWNDLWRAIVRLAGGENQMLPSLDEATAIRRIRRQWQSSDSSPTLALLSRFHEGGELDMQIFRRMLETLPGALHTVGRYVHDERLERQEVPTALRHWLHVASFKEQLRTLYEEVVWAMVDGFEIEAWPVLLRFDELRGGRYLLRLTEEVVHLGLTSIPAFPHSYWYERVGAAQVIGNLLGKVQRQDDDRDALVALLQRIDVPALLAVLPHVRPFEDEICAALGWDGSVELARLLHQIDQDDPAGSTDPQKGIVDRRAVEDIVTRLGEEHVGIILNAFKAVHPSATFLVQAVLGWNRTDVRRAFGRRKPLAARAMALLPFDARDTAQKRYLELTAFYREANTSAAGKKAAERAAAESGLTNLAFHAGFADATRLEWAMQEALGEQGVAIGQCWEIEDYTLTLIIRDGHPAIEVRRGQRVLKRTPSVVSRDYAYREVVRTRDLLKDQRRRYCEAFVNAMRRGEPLNEAEIRMLARNPVAADLLGRLVLRDDAGAFGVLRAEDMTLEGYHEEHVPITSNVYVAHPYDLAQAGMLVDWQTEIVRRQLVQPFKQVFRELYLLTPAEINAKVQSRRFAGRHLKGRQTMAVLANLGWSIAGGTITKPFYELGYAAHFDIGYDWWDWNDEDTRHVSGMLEFWPLKLDVSVWHQTQERRIAIVTVPPRVLSEVLRDLDLVTVVAHHAEESGSSREVLARRGDLVRATSAALGMSNVVVDDPFVRVHGSRASYRIHLATAAIHIESGAYLCIVPDTKQRKTTYLPFEDGGDPLSSELISKMLLLANDARIEDQTILAQLPRQRVA